MPNIPNNLSSGKYDDYFAIWGVNFPTKTSPVSTHDPKITILFLSKFWSNLASRCGILLLNLSQP